MRTLDEAQVKFDASGLVPAVVQDAGTMCVLMLGYMNIDALRATSASGFVTFWSRKRACLWLKGETSGNRLRVRELLLDCDGDTVLVKAVPQGPTCHTGSDTCFDESIGASPFTLGKLEDLLRDRLARPQVDSYSSGLLLGPVERAAQKVGEEAVEVVIEAMKNDVNRLREESADLLFHLIVLLVRRGVSLGSVMSVLASRNRASVPAPAGG